MKQLRDFILHQQDQELIRFRPTVPLERRDTFAQSTHGEPLTPEETSRLLIASFETFTQSRGTIKALTFC